VKSASCAPSGAQDENSARRNFPTSSIRKERGEQGRERRGGLRRRFDINVRIRRTAGSQARNRYVDDDSGPIDAGQRGQMVFERKYLVRAPRGSIGPPPCLHRLRSRHAPRLLYFTALIIVIGFAGLVASSVSWRKLSNLTETASIGRGAEPQPEEMTDADRSAQNASIVGVRPLTSRPTIARLVRAGRNPGVRGVDPIARNNAGHAAGAGAGRRQT